MIAPSSSEGIACGRPSAPTREGRARWLATTSTLILASAAGYAGCGVDASDCTLSLTCPPYAEAVQNDAGADGADGPDASAGPGCDGAPMGRDAGPAPDCGVFADPAAPPGGDGSKASPLASLQEAVMRAAAKGLPVFACGKVFAERLDVPAGVTV
jgi:hypothetical protein